MVFGGVGYEQLPAYWPMASDEVSRVQRRMMHELAKYVLSKGLPATSWHNSRVLGNNFSTEVTA